MLGRRFPAWAGLAELSLSSASMSDTVELTDLEVITRFSLAVRTAKADRADVVAALRADLAWLEGGRTRTSTTAAVDAEPEAPARPAVTRSAPVKAAPPRKAAPARKAAPERTAAPAKKAVA